MAETPVIETNTPGWFDLSTSDPEAARAFYANLFGWTADLVPDPRAGGYGFFNLEGKMVGGVGPLQSQRKPTAWNAYIIVADAAATVSKAKAAGGTVLVEPIDVMGRGTMAFLEDPAGAAIGIWQPALHQGVQVKDVPGSVTWIELHTRDLEAVRAFYGSVFGWGHRDTEMGGMVYTEFTLGGASLAGATPLRPGEDVYPSYWLIYFGVADVDAGTARAEEHGGPALVPPTDFSGGRFSVIRDPQGGIIGLLRLNP
ncbi:MAG TPA: VOC family protein [Candidatus Binatia bacterium]|nr:VOC family protein [Candidatus Binatia bacterium]